MKLSQFLERMHQTMTLREAVMLLAVAERAPRGAWVAERQLSEILPCTLPLPSKQGRSLEARGLVTRRITSLPQQAGGNFTEISLSDAGQKYLMQLQLQQEHMED
jgi:DNA-binding MarR family transcriptional regulator